MPELTAPRIGMAPVGPPRAPRGAAVSGIGIAVPETVVGNDEVAARAGVTEDWIVVRTGVHERRVAAARRGPGRLRGAGSGAAASRPPGSSRSRSTWSSWRR